MSVNIQIIAAKRVQANLLFDTSLLSEYVTQRNIVFT